MNPWYGLRYHLAPDNIHIQCLHFLQYLINICVRVHHQHQFLKIWSSNKFIISNCISALILPAPPLYILNFSFYILDASFICIAFSFKFWWLWLWPVSPIKCLSPVIPCPTFLFLFCPPQSSEYLTQLDSPLLFFTYVIPHLKFTN